MALTSQLRFLVLCYYVDYKVRREKKIVVKIYCLHKIKEERKRSNTQIKNTRIYMVQQKEKRKDIRM